MNFFRKDKLKIKRENVQNGVRVNIEYFKLNDPEKFKIKLLKSIIGSKLCLIIINTKLMYREQHKDYSNDLSELITQLDKLGIQYKRIVVKRAQNVSIFGVSIKQNDNRKYEDSIIGLVIKADDLDNIVVKLNNYNLQYYIDSNKISADELLNRFESNFDDEENLKSVFKYSIFEDNFMKQIALYSTKEDSEYIYEILEELNKALFIKTN